MNRNIEDNSAKSRRGITGEIGKVVSPGDRDAKNAPASSSTFSFSMPTHIASCQVFCAWLFAFQLPLPQAGMRPKLEGSSQSTTQCCHHANLVMVAGRCHIQRPQPVISLVSLSLLRRIGTDEVGQSHRHGGAQRGKGRMPARPKQQQRQSMCGGAPKRAGRGWCLHGLVIWELTLHLHPNLGHCLMCKATGRHACSTAAAAQCA